MNFVVLLLSVFCFRFVFLCGPIVSILGKRRFNFLSCIHVASVLVTPQSETCTCFVACFAIDVTMCAPLHKFIEVDIVPFEKKFNLSGNMCITLAQMQEAGLYIDRKEWVSGSHSSKPPIPGFRKGIFCRRFVVFLGPLIHLFWTHGG